MMLCRIRSTPWLLPLLVLLASALLPLLAPELHAAGGCGSSAQGSSHGPRIAAIACREHALWYSPFIDIDGRLASMTVVEAEATPLTDGTPAWQRVAGYWRGSGLLQQMASFPGASQCTHAGGGSSPWCRSFVVDQPWSAAFVSWVLVQARLPGFQPSASHVDYVRAALVRADASAFRLADPDGEPATVGDLLCYVRSEARQFGHAGLREFLGRPGSGALNMHCDIVVAVDRAAGRLQLVGGNVLQGVTMRLIPINRRGLPWNLPRGAGRATTCWPANPAGCSFNRRDWAALLKLRPGAEIAGLAPPMPLLPAHGRPAQPSGQRCCVHCVVGSGVPRCPSLRQPPPRPPQGG